VDRPFVVPTLEHHLHRRSSPDPGAHLHQEGNKIYIISKIIRTFAPSYFPGFSGKVLSTGSLLEREPVPLFVYHLWNKSHLSNKRGKSHEGSIFLFRFFSFPFRFCHHRKASTPGEPHQGEKPQPKKTASYPF